jgi:hypothetical protein
MEELNQYAISKILGSQMTPTRRASFGNFHLLETMAESLRARQASTPVEEAVHFSYEQDALVVKAFEEVRDGAAPDAILWDRQLSQAFIQQCRDLNLPGTNAYLNRRLINIRKNIRRYETHGISISATTRSDPHPSIVQQYAHVIEFALVRLRYRFGASIDDILVDPDLGDKFEQLALGIAPTLASTDLRLGALYIRKTRHFAKTELRKSDSLDVHQLDKEWSKPGSLATVHASDVPSSPGLIEMKERDRYLYIARNDNIRPAVEQLQSGKAFELVANGFWKPSLEDITIQFVQGTKFHGAGINMWERKLIRDLEPIFNWPIPKHAA